MFRRKVVGNGSLNKTEGGMEGGRKGRKNFYRVNMVDDRGLNNTGRRRERGRKEWDGKI